MEVIGRDVELRRVGGVLKGLSPFHPEKHASFVVWPATQSWHDYSNGGGLGGDVFTYVQERERSADVVLDAITAKFGLCWRVLIEAMKQIGLAQKQAAEGAVAKAGSKAPKTTVVNGSASATAAASSAASVPRAGRPEICVTGRHLYDLVVEAHAVLATANQRRLQLAAAGNVEDDEVPLFRRGNLLARLERPEDAAPRLTEVTEPAMYGLIMREIGWVRETEQGPMPVYPPDKVARDLLIHPRSTFPRVNSVITTSTFGRDGQLLLTPGLHARDRLWFDPDPSLQLREIPGHPTSDDVAAARALFFDDLLVDFPFDGPSDRAHALAALLLPFLQRMIDGCTPLHVMEAPGAGAGKGLLCNLVAILLTGDGCTPERSQTPTKKSARC